MPNTPFQPGQLVRLKSQPDTRAAVIAVNNSGQEIQYTVLLDGQTRTFFASQLIVEQQEDFEVEKLSANECKALLTACYINHPGTSTLYSLNAARINFIPYQFRPVLRFIRADRPRLLIADGVGVGKTIEAGLILRELQARQDVNSVLIICPRPLLTEKKWLNEMKRFDQTFEQFDGAKMRHCISECELDGEWSEKYRFGIVPYSILNEQMMFGTNQGVKIHKPCLLDLDPPPRFDLVIVDEAHRIANPKTYGHKVVRYFCDNADAVLFLTATPLQLASGDLFNLLNLLRPDIVINHDSFNHMSEPNPKINSAVTHARSAAPDWNKQALKKLLEAKATSWGQKMFVNNPEVLKMEKQLNSEFVDDATRIEIINKLEELHTFSSIINRTRRRDIGAFTIRRPETVEIPFTRPQKQLHDALLAAQAEIFLKAQGSQLLKLFMTNIRRQAASSIFALAPFIEEILNRYECAFDYSEIDVASLKPNSNEMTTLEENIKEVVKMAESLPPEDPKLQAVISIVQKKQNPKEHHNHRVMLFSFFRHTLRYLEKSLRNEGVRVGMIHGDVPDDERTKLREQFERDKNNSQAIDVLLFSEVGCEGLDYQFCDCMINYDLPWNPMRVEQRIGRIDRFGQKSEFVSIHNLITPGTIDADIYDRCLLRIGIFNEAMGDSEEILGEITNDIQSIALDPTLTSGERQEKLQQLADNKIRLIQEERKLENQQAEFFGINLPTQNRIEDEVKDASSFWLEPEAMNNLLNLYLHSIDSSAAILGDKPLKTLRTNQDARSKLLYDAKQLPGKGNSYQRDWERWLNNGDSHLSVTFDGECANDHRDAQLLTPVHPLIRQAAKTLDSTKNLKVHLIVSDPDLPEGIHPFAVYQWEMIGLRRNLEIVVVTKEIELNAKLMTLLQTATDSVTEGNYQVSTEDISELESRHYELWKDALNGYRDQIVNLANFKKESLNVSHQSRVAMLNDRLLTAKDERICRMKQSEIDSAIRDYEHRLAELQRTADHADITTEQILIGTIEIVKELNS